MHVARQRSAKQGLVCSAGGEQQQHTNGSSSTQTAAAAHKRWAGSSGGSSSSSSMHSPAEYHHSVLCLHRHTHAAKFGCSHPLCRGFIFSGKVAIRKREQGVGRGRRHKRCSCVLARLNFGGSEKCAQGLLECMSAWKRGRATGAAQPPAREPMQMQCLETQTAAAALRRKVPCRRVKTARNVDAAAAARDLQPSSTANTSTMLQLPAASHRRKEKGRASRMQMAAAAMSNADERERRAARHSRRRCK